MSYLNTIPTIGSLHIINNDYDMLDLHDGDYYFDSRDDKYYMYYNGVSTEIMTTISSSGSIFGNNIYNSNIYSNSYTNSSITYTPYYDKETIKTYLKDNPELLDELIMEIRKEKIEKILNENR